MFYIRKYSYTLFVIEVITEVIIIKKDEKVIFMNKFPALGYRAIGCRLIGITFFRPNCFFSSKAGDRYCTNRYCIKFNGKWTYNIYIVFVDR